MLLNLGVGTFNARHDLTISYGHGVGAPLRVEDDAALFGVASSISIKRVAKFTEEVRGVSCDVLEEPIAPRGRGKAELAN